MSESVHSSLKSAAKGAALVFTGMAVSQVLWFAARLLIVRNISKEELGIYTLIVALVSIASLVSSLGLWEGSTRYISVLMGQGRQEDAESIQRSALWIGAITSLAACTLFFLLSGVLSGYVFYKPGLYVPLMIAALFIPANVVATIFASILRGYHIIRPKVYFMDIGQPLLFLVLLALIFLFGLPFIDVIWAYVISISTVCVLMAVYGYREKGIKLFARIKDRSHVAELLKFSIPVLTMDLMFLIFRTVDTLMLGRYGSAEEVGVYSIGVSLAVFLILPMMALDFVYMPIAGELYAKSRLSELSRTYRVLTKWIFSVTLPLFFILFFFPEMTITFLFGDRFTDASLPLRILSLGYLFFVFMGTNSMLLLVLGHSRAVMKVSSAGALLNVLLNYFLIKHAGLGMYGAAVSSAVSLFAITLGYSFLLYRLSGIQPVSAVYLKPVIGSSVIGLLIYGAAKSIPLYYWMLPVYFLLYIVGYMASLILTRSIDEDDIQLLETLLNKFGVAPVITKKITDSIYEKLK